VVGIFHLPLLADLLKAVMPNRVGRLASSAFRPLLRALVYAVTYAMIHFYTLVWSPLYVSLDRSAVLYVVMLALAVHCFAQSMFHYTYAAFGEPGVPLAVKSSKGILPLALPCDRCAQPRCDESVHHCSTCGQCVRAFDHHCPITGRCVGSANFAHFYLWICAMFAGLLYGAVLALPPFLRCLFDVRAMDALFIDADGVCPSLGAYSLLFVPVTSLVLLVGTLLVLESFLLVSNQSTIDWWLERFGTRREIAANSRAAASPTAYPTHYGRGDKITYMLVRGRSLWQMCTIYRPQTTLDWLFTRASNKSKQS
jgi:DHHC palmitoyltransferase